MIEQMESFKINTTGLKVQDFFRVICNRLHDGYANKNVSQGVIYGK